ncbi:MAG: DUF6054 family protein [Candidatus Thorarchaeota archaeon]
MKTLSFDAQDVQRVINYLSSNYAAVTRKISENDQSIMAIFIHEEYVFRTGSYQTLTSIVESKGDFGQATLTVVGSGGGEGICNFNWGSQSAGEDTVIRNVQQIIRQGYVREDYDRHYYEGQR